MKIRFYQPAIWIFLTVLLVNPARTQTGPLSERTQEILLSSLLVIASHPIKTQSPVGYAFYFQPVGGEKDMVLSYIASAGHIVGGYTAHQPPRWVYSEDCFWSPLMLSVAFTTPSHDLLIGYTDDCRAKRTFFYASTNAEVLVKEKVAFTVTKPARIGQRPKFQKLQLITKKGDEVSAEDPCPNPWPLTFKAEYSALPGMSGAPVVNSLGNLVGIFVQTCPSDSKIYYVTPSSQIEEIFNRYVK